MIEDADDEKLLELAHHVGIEVGKKQSGIDPPFWNERELRIFISHLAEHRDYASELRENLNEYGISCFVAHDDIEPTKEWEEEIIVALSTCEVLIALLHTGFKQSSWTDQEVGYAMGRGIPAFSVRFNEDPYGFIGRFQAFKGGDKEPKALSEEIFNALRNKKELQRRMAEIIVTRFERSNTYKNAIFNMELLEGLEVWTPSFSERIKNAAKSNSQIRGAYGVPRRVKRLIKEKE